MMILIKGFLTLMYFVNTNFVNTSIYKEEVPVRIPPKVEPSFVETDVSGVPDRILIPNLNIDLEVRSTEPRSGTWFTYKDAASFGVGSSYLNSPIGNTVVFAHAKQGLFKGLGKLIIGDPVILRSSNSWYSYEVKKKFLVDPNDVSFLKRDFGRSLILITCYGEDDEKRIVIVAKEKGGLSGQKTI